MFLALVFPLFTKWDPSAIARLIITIIIAAFDRKIISVTMGKRPVTKWLKIVPLGTNSNAAFAVITEIILVRIGASLLHAKPNSMQSLWHAAMCAIALPDAFKSQTSARLRVTASQKITDNNCLISTRTTAPPKCISVSRAGSFDHGQSTECLSSDILGNGQCDLLQRLLRQVAGWRSNANPLRILASIRT